MSDRKRLAHLVKSTDQRRVLIELVRRHGWRWGAEIGVLRGKTLFSLLDACPALNMMGVDQWRQLPLRSDLNAETYSDFDMEQLAADVASRAAGYFPRCQIIRADSVEAAEDVEDGSLDFVFIDGDHTSAGVERDIRAWAPKVRMGGAVLGHDHHWASVRPVLDRMCPAWRDLGEAVWMVWREGVDLS